MVKRNPEMLQVLLFFIGAFQVCCWSSFAAGTSSPARVVVFGDSTTAVREGLVVYGALLETQCRSLGIPVDVINAGVRGNTTDHAAERFHADVILRRPDLVVLQFGINDSAVDVWKIPAASQPRVSLERYVENLQRFVDTLRQQNVPVVLMTPNPLQWTPQLVELYGRPPYDVTDPEGLNVILRHYADAVRRIAAEKEVPLVDVMALHQERGHDRAEPLLSDGIHPNQRGHALVAHHLVELIRREQLLGGTKH
jgi:lysophospholipase L1-like esterase